jgi:hypothetical protein
MKKDPPLKPSRRSPPPYSNTDECRRRKETSDGDSSSGSDPEGAGGGVGATLGGGLPSLDGERVRLVPLLSSIVREERSRKINPKRERKNE